MRAARPTTWARSRSPELGCRWSPMRQSRLGRCRVVLANDYSGQAPGTGGVIRTASYRRPAASGPPTTSPAVAILTAGSDAPECASTDRDHPERGDPGSCCAPTVGPRITYYDVPPVSASSIAVTLQARAAKANNLCATAGVWIPRRESRSYYRPIGEPRWCCSACEDRCRSTRRSPADVALAHRPSGRSRRRRRRAAASRRRRWPAVPRRVGRPATMLRSASQTMEPRCGYPATRWFPNWPPVGACR